MTGFSLKEGNIVEMKVGTSVNALSALTGWVRMGKRVAALKFHPWSGN